MSNYVKLTDFASKDALSTGNPLKLIKGTEINDEFNAIQTAIGTKADLASPALLGNPTAPTQSLGNDSTRLATTAFVQAAIQLLYPVGVIYTTIDATNPNLLFGFGTWVAFGTGKVLVGINAADALFDTVEKTGGSKDAVVVSHSHTVTDPGHTHLGSVYNYYSASLGGGGYVSGISQSTATTSATTGVSVNSTGVSGTNANVQPYIVVYMWKRTA